MRILLNYVVGSLSLAEFDFENASPVIVPVIGDIVHLAFDDDTPYIINRRLVRHVSSTCIGVLCEIESIA